MTLKKLRLDADNEIIHHIREIIHLIPCQCTIKIDYDDIVIIPSCTPDEHHELYYALKEIGQLEEFINYGKYKLSQHSKKTKPPDTEQKYPRLAFSSERE